MSAVINTDDRSNKSENHYPASNKKNPPKAKDKKEKFIPKGFMSVTKTSTLSLK